MSNRVITICHTRPPEGMDEEYAYSNDYKYSDEMEEADEGPVQGIIMMHDISEGLANKIQELIIKEQSCMIVNVNELTLNRENSKDNISDTKWWP